MPLLADRDLTDRGIEVDLCGHRSKMAAGPAALALASGAALHPVSIHYERVDGPSWRHRIVITFHDRVEVPATGTTRAKAVAMTQQCADALGAAIVEHTADWHMLQRVFLDDLEPRPAAAGRAPGRPGARGAGREDRHRLPLLLRRARGSAVPRPRPGRALPRARATTRRCSRPADDDTPLPDYVESVGRAVPVRYNGSVARLNFGPADRGAGRALARGAATSTCVHIHEPVTPSIALLALWSAEGPVVATFHTSNLRSRAMQAAYPLLRPEPGEDQRPDRRLRGRPAHRHDPPRR